MDREKSEFNDALSFLARVNSLFYDANISKASLDATSWYHLLNIIMAEIYDDMKKDEQDYAMKRKEDCRNCLHKYNKSQSGLQQINPVLYDELLDYELFLRKVWRNAGYKTRLMDDASSALR